MRVTNKMIMRNASSNINSTKEIVNKRNTQMTNQKKIDKPSDDPVIAVRSLRLATTLSQVTQYYKKNIPDASSWLDVTETALINMRNLVTDCRTLTVTGATDSYSEQDRKTLMTQLQALQDQLYAEGNSDYANRTVFTGYRTNKNLTFTEDETTTKYRIDQAFSIEDHMEEHRYYSGNVQVPTTEADLTNTISDISVENYYRIRLNYDNIDSINSIAFQYSDANGTAYTFAYTESDTTQSFDNTVAPTETPAGTSGFSMTTYATEGDWEKAIGKKTVGDDEIVVIRETGDIIFGSKVASTLKENAATIKAQYDKTGFETGELRPEFYYDCVKMADELDVNVPVTYTKFDSNGDAISFDIEYTIAASQTIAINTEASNVFDSSLQRDLGEMVDAIQKTILAHDKIDTIKSMMAESQYASDEDQEYLQQWLDGATKEADFYDDNMQKLFSTELGKIDAYYAKINLAITDLGCKKDSLQLTQTRVGDQKETVEDLQSQNDDVDLSQIIIDYTAAYTAYQASLTAAGKLGDSTLLNYI
ncbi:MAG: flagellar hook-associated protein 3 [Pseudobutyrivibrio sp.]|nr:flagellar hook-associated protein 3 [Pseudobutyrivibrio sp.]